LGKKRIIIGISGASGAVYGARAIELLRNQNIETHLVITKAAELTLENEGFGPSKEIFQKADYSYKIADVGAAIASGSFKTDGMIIAPCSIKTMSEIAYGITGNILTRAADVTLKERRPLLLMVRETPLHFGHLETMTRLNQMGAIIFPPVPAFYSGLTSLDDMIDQTVARALDMLGIEINVLRRWGEKSEENN
jgi:4-hydroxy-3-polyprenylbenzoate decarboxylase